MSKLETIPNFSSYKASKKGDIYSYKWGKRKLKGYKDKYGYTIYEVVDDNGNIHRYGGHQLVLFTFVGPKPKGKETRHLNGKKSDNRLKNLKWGSSTKNNRDKIKHGTITKGTEVNTSKLNEDKVRRIRYLRNVKKYTTTRLAKMFGV